MVYVRTTIEMKNPRETNLGPVTASALVDIGALMLCIPEHLKVQLNFSELEKREITTADGKRQLVPYVGPVQPRFCIRTRDSTKDAGHFLPQKVRPWNHHGLHFFRRNRLGLLRLGPHA